MGICYSEEEEWQAYNKNYRERRKKKRTKAQNSVIYEERTIQEGSFNSGVQSSFRESSHVLHTIFTQDSIAMGSISELSELEKQNLEKSLQTINSEGELHNENQLFSLSNLKSKNFLHTHRVRLPEQCRQNQVSCCPYNSSHMVEYDLWKIIRSQNNDRHYIYHPFTQRFLNVKKEQVVCSQQKLQWEIKSYGARRNGGYIKLICQYGELCMTSERALLQNHRRLIICKQNHISHIWEMKFGEAVDLSDQMLA